MKIKFLKKWRQEFLRKLGYSIISNRNFDDVLDEIINSVYSKNDQLVIFDIGANIGTSIDRFEKLIKQHHHIHSFEPSKKLFSLLIEKYSSNKDVTLNNLGVSDQAGELMFNDFESANGSSSFAGMHSDDAYSKHRNINSTNTKIYPVRIDTVDNYCESHKIKQINLIKIDVQSYEKYVLAGCKNMIAENKIDIIEVEVLIAQPYKERTSFFDIEKNLIDFGYRLFAVSNDGRFYNTGYFDLLQNKSLYLDAIYVNDKLFEKLTHSNN